MVGVFRRSLLHSMASSLQKPSPSPLHARSVSLPTTSHPLTSILNRNLSVLKSHSSSSEHASSRLLDRLTLLESTLVTLSDIILLPRSQLSLHSCPQQLVECLLEDFLSFVDVHCIFRTRISSLKDSSLAARIALRRKDATRLCFYVKHSKKLGKELLKLTTGLGKIGKYTGSDNELAGTVKEVVKATAAVTSELLEGFSASLVGRKRQLSLWKKQKESDGEGIEEVKTVVVGVETMVGKLGGLKEEEAREVVRKMEEMEEWLGKIERECERLFRCLINTRVSLLNALSLPL